jgi:hypothetical protein
MSLVSVFKKKNGRIINSKYRFQRLLTIITV